MIKRIGTAKATSNRPAIIIEFNDESVVNITTADLSTHDTPEKLLNEAKKQAKKEFTNIYFHINQNGSVAVAYKEEPLIWPEDADNI